MKRSPLKRGTKPLRRAKAMIRPSKSASDFPPEARERTRERSNGWCEAAATPNCLKRAGHLHHILPRGRGGRGTLDNALDVCASCHDYIHAHPREARERGWLRSAE